MRPTVIEAGHGFERGSLSHVFKCGCFLLLWGTVKKFVGSNHLRSKSVSWFNNSVAVLPILTAWINWGRIFSDFFKNYLLKSHLLAALNFSWPNSQAAMRDAWVHSIEDAAKSLWPQARCLSCSPPTWGHDPVWIILSITKIIEMGWYHQLTSLKLKVNHIGAAGRNEVWVVSTDQRYNEWFPLPKVSWFPGSLGNAWCASVV